MLVLNGIGPVELDVGCARMMQYGCLLKGTSSSSMVDQGWDFPSSLSLGEMLNFQGHFIDGACTKAEQATWPSMTRLPATHMHVRTRAFACGTDMLVHASFICAFVSLALEAKLS